MLIEEKKENVDVGIDKLKRGDVFYHNGIPYYLIDVEKSLLCGNYDNQILAVNLDKNKVVLFSNNNTIVLVEIVKAKLIVER